MCIRDRDSTTTAPAAASPLPSAAADACDGHRPPHEVHRDKAKHLARLRRIEGQVRGVRDALDLEVRGLIADLGEAATPLPEEGTRVGRPLDLYPPGV